MVHPDILVIIGVYQSVSYINIKIVGICRCLLVWWVRILVYRDEISLYHRISGVKFAFIGVSPAKLPRGRLNPSRWNNKLKFKFGVHQGTYCLPTDTDKHHQSVSVGPQGNKKPAVYQQLIIYYHNTTNRSLQVAREKQEARLSLTNH